MTNASHIIETGRSYPNPVDSEDYDRTYTSDEHPSFGSGYQIEIEGSGPGSYAFGRDEVFYIGDPTETCVEFCDADRRAVYRFYSGRWEDHFYYHKERFLKTFLKKERDIILNLVMDKTIFNSTRATYLVLFLCMLLGMGATKIVTSLLLVDRSCLDTGSQVYLQQPVRE